MAGPLGVRRGRSRRRSSPYFVSVAQFCCEPLEQRIVLSGTVEPDEFADGQSLSTVDPNVTLSEVADITTPTGSDITSSDDGTGHASTGTQTFAGSFETWGDVVAARLRMDFHVDVSSVSIDAIGLNFFGLGDIGRLEIFDAGDNLLDTYTTASLGDGTIETMSLTSETPIAYAVAYGVGSLIYLDHLVYSDGGAPDATGMVVNGGSDNRSGIDTLTISFDSPVTVGSPADLVLFNHTTGMAVSVPDATLSNDGTTAITWNLHENNFDLPDGRYTAQLAAAATTPNLAQSASFDFLKQSGDLDGDGTVNFNDTVPISLNFGASGVEPYSDGDADGDGTVNFNDTVPISLNFGATLPPMLLDTPEAAEPQTLVPPTPPGNETDDALATNPETLATTSDEIPAGPQASEVSGDEDVEAGMVAMDGEPAIPPEESLTEENAPAVRSLPGEAVDEVESPSAEQTVGLLVSDSAGRGFPRLGRLADWFFANDGDRFWRRSGGFLSIFPSSRRSR